MSSDQAPCESAIADSGSPSAGDVHSPPVAFVVLLVLFLAAAAAIPVWLFPPLGPDAQTITPSPEMIPEPYNATLAALETDIFGGWTITELYHNGRSIPVGEAAVGGFYASEHHFGYSSSMMSQPVAPAHPVARPVETDTPECSESGAVAVDPDSANQMPCADSRTEEYFDTMTSMLSVSTTLTMCVTTLSLAHGGEFYNYSPATRSGWISLYGPRKQRADNRFTFENKLLRYRLENGELAITATDATDTWTLRCRRTP